MIQILNLQPIVDLIKAECPIFENRVFLTEPLAELKIDTHESPVCFVYESDMNSESNSILGGMRQVQHIHVTTEIVVRRTASDTDKFSEADTLTKDACRLQLLTALPGKQLAGHSYPLQHASSDRKTKDDKTLRWIETFLAQLTLTKPKGT